jgi:hypothetical protein
MKTLISPDEIVLDPNTQTPIGCRVCDIVETIFEVTKPLFWVDLLDGASNVTHCYNLESNTFVLIPEYILIEPVATEPQPVVSGAQTL